MSKAVVVLSLRPLCRCSVNVPTLHIVSVFDNLSYLLKNITSLKHCYFVWDTPLTNSQHNNDPLQEASSECNQLLSQCYQRIRFERKYACNNCSYAFNWPSSCTVILIATVLNKMSHFYSKNRQICNKLGLFIKSNLWCALNWYSLKKTAFAVIFTFMTHWAIWKKTRVKYLTGLQKSCAIPRVTGCTIFIYIRIDTDFSKWNVKLIWLDAYKPREAFSSC